MRGNFITFEGGEGSGKSTQIKLLGEAFAKAGVPYIATREPGGVESAERIRQLLVTGKGDAWLPESETLLFYAARLEHVRRRIIPAIEEGKYVLCDRFADSTLIYQGIGKGLSEDFIRSLHHVTLGDFAPDLTLILDIEPEEGLKRANAQAHNEKRFESLGLEFHRRIRDGFLSLAKRNTDRCVVVNASEDKNTVHRKIIEIVAEKLGIHVIPVNAGI
jgi:dTMP kinase